jgi:hypothetical protein
MAIMAAVAAECSWLLNFLTSQKVGSKEEQLAANEGAFACHTVSQIYSFRSMDYTSKLFQISLESKFACARTKAEAIILIFIFNKHSTREFRSQHVCIMGLLVSICYMFRSIKDHHHAIYITDSFSDYWTV